MRTVVIVGILAALLAGGYVLVQYVREDLQRYAFIPEDV